MTKKFINIKIYPEGQFRKEIKEIIAMRRATVDKTYPKELSFARLLEQTVKEPEWFYIKNKLLRMPRVDKTR